MDQQQQQQQSQTQHQHSKKRRSSASRSPSLSRRSSLRGSIGDKINLVSTGSGGVVSGGIVKSKSKRGGLSVLATASGGASGTSGASGLGGSKKERWLLTRKTWRYMTDAVGNLLPEYYGAGGGGGTAAAGAGGKGTGGRRGSSSAASGSSSVGGPASQQVSSTSTSAYPLTSSSGAPSTSSAASSSYYYYSGLPGTPSSSGYTSYSLSSPPFRQSVPRSSICSSSGAVPLVEEEECSIIPMSPTSVISSTSPGEGGGGRKTSNVDIPGLEKHFENVCSKEKKFLLWTRNKAKGLSGPALREAKLKEKEKQGQKDKEGGKSSSSKSTGGGGLFKKKSSSSIAGGGSTTIPSAAEEFGGGGGGPGMEYDEGGAGPPGAAIGPMYLTRSQSSSSSLMTMGGSSYGPSGGGPPGSGMRSGRRATQDLLDYFSPGEDDDELRLLDDADDYDEYDLDDDGPQVLEPGSIRRKSSTTSSIVSMVSGGLSFFRGKTNKSQPVQQQSSSSSGQQYSESLGTIFIRTIPSTGIQKYYRNSTVQTEPFPEEIIVRLKLQFIYEEQQHGRSGGTHNPQTPQQQQHAAQLLSQYQQQLRHVMTLPIDKSSSSSSSAMFPTLHGSGAKSSPTSSSMATAYMTGNLSTTTSPVGTPQTASEPPQQSSHFTPSTSTASASVPDTDKKSEESGYSSASIGDTVMRYLRMARKSSKADNKETIDKFKTVNYDRSLRYIKSKNVTVEEALEHEKNKALQAAAAKLGPGPAPPTLDGQEQVSAGGPSATQTTSGETATGEKVTDSKGKAKSGTGKTKKTKSKKSETKDSAGGGGDTRNSSVGDICGMENSNAGESLISQDDFDKLQGGGRRGGSLGGHGGGEGSGGDSNANSTPQTPLSPTSTTAPPSSMYSSSRSGSGSSSIPPLSPSAYLSSIPGGIPSGMMIQGSMIISTSPGATSMVPLLQQSSTLPGAIIGGFGSSSPSPPPSQFTSLLPPPPISAEIGVQVGESLVHLLRNYNPNRKLSDFSLPPSSEGGSESMYSSPRYSVISTGPGPGGYFPSCNSDSELFTTEPSHHHQNYFLSHQQDKYLVPIGATSSAMSVGVGTSPAHSSSSYGRNYSIGTGTTSHGPTSLFDPSCLDSSSRLLHQQQQQNKGGRFSSSNIGVGTSTSNLTSPLKKSASFQPMLLRIDDSSNNLNVRSPSPSNISSTSSTGSGIIIPHLGSSIHVGGSGGTTTSSYPSLLTSSPLSSPRQQHSIRHQHHSALGLYTTNTNNSPSSKNSSVSPSSAKFLAPTTTTSMNPSCSSVSLGSGGVDPHSSASSSRKKHSTLTWATPTTSGGGSSGSLPAVASSSSLNLGGKCAGVTTSSSSSRPSLSTSPSNYSSLTSSASNFLNSFRSGMRKGSNAGGPSSSSSKHKELGTSTSASSGGLLGRSSNIIRSNSDKKHKNASSSASQLISSTGLGGSGASGGGLTVSEQATSYTNPAYDDSPSSHDPSSSIVMQKSKSSSSVFHHTGTGGGSIGQTIITGGGSGGTSTSGGGSSNEKRGSNASTNSTILPSASSTTIPHSTSTGSRFMSKTRLFKSRSKSQTRVSASGSTSGAGICTWSPQGKCKWTNLNGRQIVLQPTTILHLNETERTTLQKVAVGKLQALNLDVEIKIPREKIGGTLQKPKRRPYLLKKKALSTGFFESGPKDGTNKELNAGSGLVFGIPLTQVVANDKKLEEQQKDKEKQQLIDNSSSSSVVHDWEQHLPSNASSTTTIKRSGQHNSGSSRNSVSSVFEGTTGGGGSGSAGPGPGPGGGRDEKHGTQQSGSNESLYWTRRRGGGGSGAALDSISSSSGDHLADSAHIPPSIDSAPLSSVPSIVTACIKHLEQFGLHTTGIFRVSTSLKRIRQLREDIDSGKCLEFTEEHSPHDVAALLKEFLRDLPEPLLCNDLYQAFLRTQRFNVLEVRNRKLQLESIQYLIQLLPLAHRDTLVALLKFFSKVAENASDTRSKTGEVLLGNKMEAYSLATLIAPNILPCMPTEGLSSTSSSSASNDPNSVVTQERRESIDVVNYMISNYQQLFEVPAELLDEVYLAMMDSSPDALEASLRARAGITAEDVGLDELETSSVFEGGSESEPAADIDETISISSTKKILQKREDILHKDGGKGGSGQETNPRTDKHHHSHSHSHSHSHHHHGSKSSSHYASKDSDLDKTQSGGESDSSSTKSASRWFRRAKHSTSGTDHSSSKIRASSDSGSDQISKGKKGQQLIESSTQKQQQQQQRKSPQDTTQQSQYETKRANSLDSVNLKEGSLLPNVITLTEQIYSPSGIAIDQNLQVPENINRRQSSPILLDGGSGIITASLKIPVPVNIDDTDIPYIEDDNTNDGGVIQQQLHHVYQQQQQQQSQQHVHHHVLHSSAPHHQSQLISSYNRTGRSGSTDSTGGARGIHSGTTTATSNNTPASSHGPSPLSSPIRQPSSEVSSPLFSPPMSPNSLTDDPCTFPYEEMTARFCIGGGAPHEPTSATTPLSSSSTSTSSSLHSGTTIVSKVPNTKTGATSSSSPSKLTPTTPTTPESFLIPKSPDDKPPYSTTHRSSSSNVLAGNNSNTSSTSFTNPPSSEFKSSSLLGRETKGANIAGLIKSKTADFEKIVAAQQASQQQQQQHTSPLTTSPSSSKIASSMRLRSQGNIQLKQQFLLRQTEKASQPSSTGPGPGAAPIKTSTDGGNSNRSLQRSKKTTSGSSSSSGIPGISSSASTSSHHPTSTDQQQPSSSQIQSQSQSKLPSPGGSGGGVSSSSPSKINVPGSFNIKPSSSRSLISGSGSGTSSPSRWKRSEIIASRQTGSTSSPSSSSSHQQPSSTSSTTTSNPNKHV